MRMTTKSLYANYLLPAIFLNPILFLHSLNTILSRILPPVHVAGTLQPPPYSDLGPSGCHPHLDVHYSDNLCWSYTVVMVLAQLFAFDRVTQVRSAKREWMEERLEEREQATERSRGEESNWTAKGQANGGSAREGKVAANGSAAERMSRGALKSPGRPVWREDSSSGNDSLPPN